MSDGDLSKQVYTLKVAWSSDQYVVTWQFETFVLPAYYTWHGGVIKEEVQT